MASTSEPIARPVDRRQSRVLPSHLRSSAAAKTRMLAVALGLTAFVLSTPWVNPRPALHTVAGTALLLCVMAAFFLAEHFSLRIEFRGQSHSLTFAGVPLAVGVLTLATPDLVRAWLVSAVVSLMLQRMNVDKILYNAAAYTFQAAVISTAVHAWLPAPTHSLTDGSLLVVIITVADQAMSLLVLWVIRLHTGSLSRAETVEVLVYAAALSVVCTVFAVAVVLLLHTGPIGVAAVCLLAALAVLIYRAFAATRRRHRSLQLIHDFVAVGVGAPSLSQLGFQALEQMRQALRASSATLMLLDESGEAQSTASPQLLHLQVTQDGSPRQWLAPLEHSDWVRARSLHQGEATLATRSRKDTAIGRWLEVQQLRDALVAPLLLSDGAPVGLITITDRLGDTATFTEEDRSLLKTLSGHLAVALRGARLVERLSHDASHDSLTGLANRAQLHTAIRAARQDAADSAVLLLDLDKFKEVNDVLGHEVGDRLLVVVADRLRACLPENATIARLGGDEFAVLLPGLAAEATRTALALADTVHSALSEPVRFEEAVLTPTASIGVALDGAGPGLNLLRCADTAMYAAKHGQRQVVLYDPAMDRGRSERLALVGDLRSALNTRPNQFSVYFQPKISLTDGRVASVEALVRWNHPRLGTIAPDQFVPLAETSGLIGQLTVHILEQALRACGSWHRHGIDISVAVNLSARNLADPSLPHRILAILAASGLPPRQLILEITETSAMEDPDQVLPVLNQLHDLGIAISLDDFGTGYSSLAYLQKLPVQELKIDRSFVAGLTADASGNAHALISTIAALGHSLHLRIVAEGIETLEQLHAVTKLGCHLAQGYYVCQPLPPEAVLPWLAAQIPTLPSAAEAAGAARGLPVRLPSVRTPRQAPTMPQPPQAAAAIAATPPPRRSGWPPGMALVQDGP